jgi:Uma2 family endonuclease
MARARPEPPRPWTVEEFLDWERAQPDKYEYLDGVIRMMVGGTSDHYTIALNIASTFRAKLRGTPCRAYMEGMKVDIGSGIAYPDVVVTCSEVGPKRDEVPEPVIVVEVLSASTESLDRGTKWLGYQSLPSLRQYVLVSQDQQQVEVFERETSGWAYTVLQGKAATLRCAVGSVEMTMAEIYEDTSLDPGRAAG